MQDTILVFTGNVDRWGAERSITSMCAGLQAKGYKVLVIIPRLGEIQDLLKEVGVEYMIFPFPMAIVGASHNELPLWRRFVRKRHLIIDYWKMLFNLRKLRKELLDKSINPMAVYSATITIDFGVRFARFMRIKHIQHIRENLSAFGYQLRSGNKKGFKLLRDNSEVVICTCNAIKDCYKDFFSPDAMHVIHNGVPEVKLKKKVKSSDCFLLIQTTRLMKDKNVMDSLQAVERLIALGCDKVRLDIYGKGEEEEKLRKYINEHNLSNYIKLKGFCDSIDYSIYHIGLITSVFEAFARSTIEYMNHGLAVVASDTGGNLEQVVDGETGFFYKLGDPKDMAEILKKIYDNPQMIVSLGDCGRKRFSECFTQQRYVQRITDIIISNINE